MSLKHKEVVFQNRAKQAILSLEAKYQLPLHKCQGLDEDEQIIV